MYSTKRLSLVLRRTFVVYWTWRRRHRLKSIGRTAVVRLEGSMEQQNRPRGMRAFLLIWSGQLVSFLGSGLTGFALGVWVFQRTGSATQLTLISFFAMLPYIAFWPLAGALVDRWDRRWALVVSEAGAALAPLTIILLLSTGRFQIWQIYLVVAISAAFRSFQFPAFSAATTLLVPKEQ